MISVVKVDSLLKKSLLSDTLNITNLIRRNETDHAAKTPAQWKTLFENVPFHRENYYTGPLGPDYTPGGTCLRLWAPTAEAVTVTLYHKGDGGAVLGTKPLVRGAQGVWSSGCPGGAPAAITPLPSPWTRHRETGDPYAWAAGVNGVRSMIVDLARTAPPGGSGMCAPISPRAARRVGGERAGLLAGCRQRSAPGVAG